MFGTLRDILAFAYKATERMEEKTARIQEERKNRAEEFRAKLRSTKEEMEQSFHEQRERIKSEVQRVVKETGLATKDDMDELRRAVLEIGQKVDKLGGK